MKKQLFRCLALAPLSLALTGCQSAMSSPPTPSDDSYSNVNAEWPLKFRGHYFRGVCYSTYGCRIHYGHYYPGDPPDDVLEVSSESVTTYPDNLNASWGPLPNFPPPAEVTWRSKDGTPHEAKIDIGEIFKDQLIRHNVAHEDASDPASDGTPAIILEVNDRTINVYMRATIWLKKPRFPEKPLSDSQRDLIKVFSRTY